MKIKIKLILLVSCMSIVPRSAFAMMSNPAAIQAVQELLQNPKERQRFLAQQIQAIGVELEKESNATIDDLISQDPYTFFCTYLMIHPASRKSTKHTSEIMKQLNPKVKIEVLAKMMLNKQLTQMGLPMLILGMQAQKEGQEVKDSHNDSEIPNDHVLILTVEEAEELGKSIKETLQAIKMFGFAQNLSFRNLDMNTWRSSFAKEEEWIALLTEKIKLVKNQGAKKIIKNASAEINTPDMAIVGNDFESEVNRDCELSNAYTIVRAMAHAMIPRSEIASSGQPSVEDVLKQLTNPERLHERCEKHKGTGTLAIIRKDMPLMLQKMLPKSPLTDHPFLEKAKILLAARTAPSSH
jgi:hypothetical protein